MALNNLCHNDYIALTDGETSRTDRRQRTSLPGDALSVHDAVYGAHSTRGSVSVVERLSYWRRPAAVPGEGQELLHSLRGNEFSSVGLHPVSSGGIYVAVNSSQVLE